DDAADEVDLVLLEHLVGELLADIGLALVVAIDDLDVEAADLPAKVIERQLDGVLHVLADDAGRSRQRGDETDLDRLRRAHCLARSQRRDDAENYRDP